jgi:hypothetical protein
MISRNLLTTFVLSAGLAFSPPAFSADVIGEVEMLSVWAYGTPPDEPRRDLRARSDVHADELIETVKSAEVLIRFEDGTTLGLGAESTIYLDELVYDGGAGDSMVLTITQGFFHFVTGDIAPEAVVIETPAMIIGIRGTDLAIGVDGNGTSTVGVRDGAATATPVRPQQRKSATVPSVSAMVCPPDWPVPCPAVVRAAAAVGVTAAAMAAVAEVAADTTEDATVY